MNAAERKNANHRWCLLLGALWSALLLFSGVEPSGAKATTAAVSEGDASLPSSETDQCENELPIVVASDVAAQSDLYSAITLAGVLETNCIVFSGARDGTFPSLQYLKLANARSGGWIVGGAAAVPDWKTAFFSLERIAGRDRWHTARLVGAVAADPDADIAQLTSTIDSWNPLTDEIDCEGAEPIVVASDVAAESDLYSAVTLAGVLGTECIVFAGPRDGPMPSDQLALLDSAWPGGWIVGGTAAVPERKVAGRAMERVAGADRWQTARRVGEIAAELQN